MIDRDTIADRLCSAPSPGVLLCAGLAAVYLAVVATRILIATDLDLYWDEAYYWQASKRLAVGYVDKPFVTALLVKLGTLVAGATKLGVRLMFLIIGAGFPIALYYFALPFVGRRDAVLAAGISFLMPGTAVMGFMAFQDVAMVFVGLLALTFFDRARRGDSIWAWLAFGLTSALGLSTHYRFAPLLLALFVYLLTTTEGRSLLKRGGLWLAASIAALGALPLLIFNLQTGLVSFQFQVMERNPWTFQLKGLRYPLEQALAVTPVLFVALIATLIYAWLRARRGDRDCTFLVICSGVYLGFYFLLAPWADLNHFNAHWPATGYLPLFVLLPTALRHFLDAGSPRWRGIRIGLILLVPTSALAAVIGLFAILISASRPGAATDSIFPSQFRHELLPWTALAERVEAHLDHSVEESGNGQAAILIGGDYRIAVALDFLLKPNPGVFVLDHVLNHRDGLWYQYELWDLDQRSLIDLYPGAAVLLVIADRSDWGASEAEIRWRAGLCALIDEARQIDSLEMPHAELNFRIYSGKIRDQDERVRAALVPRGPGNCGLLPAEYFARPRPGATISGKVESWGWALDDGVGVRSVEIMVDDHAVAEAHYGDILYLLAELGPLDRMMPGSTDPNHPYTFFAHNWYTTEVPEGPHRVWIRIRYRDGRTRDAAHRSVLIRHPDGGTP